MIIRLFLLQSYIVLNHSGERLWDKQTIEKFYHRCTQARSTSISNCKKTSTKKPQQQQLNDKHCAGYLLIHNNNNIFISENGKKLDK